MRRTDAVLDVKIIARRALEPGPDVTVERIEGALHDVFLSAAAGARGRLRPAVDRVARRTPTAPRSS